MVETASLELCKKLSVLCLDAKTEYIWVKYDKGEPFVVTIEEWENQNTDGSVIEIYKIICLAWQIHELLDLFKGEGLEIWQTEQNKYIAYFTNFIGIEQMFEDVRLVDALAKLAIWRKENE